MDLRSSQGSNSFKSSSSKTHHRRYDVFLSFRGADVGHKFLESIHYSLQHQGILAFIDDVELENGEIINDGLFEAIEESRIAVVFISENYATSSWSLRELEHILECKRTNGLIVYPVFYYVSPSDVRGQRGVFGKGFGKACSRQEEESVKRWRDALKEVASLKGWNFPEASCLIFDLIVEEITEKIGTRAAYGEEVGDNSFVQVIDYYSPDKVVTRRKRKRAALSLASGMHYIEACRPCLTPHSVGESSTYESDDMMAGIETSFQDTFLDETQVSDSSVESECGLTIKAKCGGLTFKFRLFPSSGIQELRQQVSQRLNLEVGTYVVKYLDDDNDWVSILCDDDLHMCISSSISQGKYTLRILIEAFSCNEVISSFVVVAT